MGGQGAISYRIKPASTAGVGTVMTNAANIYFDYNYPIATNTVTTTVAALANPTFDGASFSLSPNPAGNELLITNSGSIAVSQLRIFNLLGQEILAMPAHFANRSMRVDLTALASGAYILQLSGSGNPVAKKFVKM